MSGEAAGRERSADQAVRVWAQQEDMQCSHTGKKVNMPEIS